MSKGFNYPFLANCKDIKNRLEEISKPEDSKIIEAAKYVIQTLE
jgi:hypothetical protein